MRVLIAEDHSLFREVLQKVAIETGHTIMCVTDSVEAAVAAYRADSPDLLLLDMRLGSDSAGPLIEEACATAKLSRIMVVSGYLCEYLVFRLERAKPLAITSFVDKRDASLATLNEALAATIRGQRWLSPTYVTLRSKMWNDQRAFYRVLSDRLELFLRFVACDSTDQEIASFLDVSIRTVEGYRSSVLHRLNLNSSVQLAAYARTRGFDLFPVRREDHEQRVLDTCGRSTSDRIDTQ